MGASARVAEHSHPPGAPRRVSAHTWVRIGQWVLVALIVFFAVRGVRGQWHEVQSKIGRLDVAWLPILVASAIVFSVYLLLIETWRRMLGAWEERMPFGEAAQIWFASSLGKYVPGYIWSLTAMGVMAREQGTSAVAAAGSSVIVNAINIAVGIGISLACVSQRFDHPWFVVALDFAGLAVLITVLCVPAYLKPIVRQVNRITGRKLELPHVAPKTVVFTIVSTSIAWIGYGIAFKLFSDGVLHETGLNPFDLSSVLLFIGLYSGAYIFALISPIPAGFGAREGALFAGLTELGLMTAGSATIVVVLSRVWLTVLEVIPGFISLLINRTKTHSRHAS